MSFNMSDFYNVPGLTFPGLADEIDGRGVKACIVCDTPAARTNSSRNSVLVFPRALKSFVIFGGWWRKIKSKIVV